MGINVIVQILHNFCLCYIKLSLWFHYEQNVIKEDVRFSSDFYKICLILKKKDEILARSIDDLVTF